ncbi:uncharacterized protein LOC135400949 isoform X3 [Ornithodoros turicata]|uniref:uncharacterized protein LOC135400949 isoform X3 n=1 Tax=Ornithodoros turicata TaxID=34597 RepID=UPI003138A2B4
MMEKVGGEGKDVASPALPGDMAAPSDRRASIARPPDKQPSIAGPSAVAPPAGIVAQGPAPVAAEVNPQQPPLGPVDMPLEMKAQQQEEP